MGGAAVARECWSGATPQGSLGSEIRFHQREAGRAVREEHVAPLADATELKGVLHGCQYDSRVSQAALRAWSSNAGEMASQAPESANPPTVRSPANTALLSAATRVGYSAQALTWEMTSRGFSVSGGTVMSK